MARKIYDIMPPKVAHKIEHAIHSLEKGPAKKKRGAKVVAHVAPTKKVHATPVHTKVRTFPKRELFIGGAAVVLLSAIYFYGGLARATVEISPVTETLSFQEKISADTSYENVNLLKKIIPARMLVQEQQGSQEFSATGSASNEGKATGTLKVYNKVSPGAPVTLKAGTHFLSDSGKYFVSLERIVIPAMQKSTAGSIDVKVQAEESGDAYNIGPSKFSVPKLAGTALYYSIWAESKGDMEGGYTGSVKKVTKDDISGAKDALTQKLLAESETALRQNISPDEVLLDGALAKTVIESSASVKEGAIAQSFNQTAKVKVSALVFKKEDIQKFAKLDAQSKLPEGKELREESLEISYAPDTIDLEAGIGKLNLKVSGASYYFIDENSLAEAFVQKNASQIQQAVETEYGTNISATKVNFWPFWVSKAPKDKSKIKIELVFE